MRINLLKMNYGLWSLQASQNCFHETFWPVPSPVPLETRGWGLSLTTQPSGWEHMTQRQDVGGQERVPPGQRQFQLSASHLPGAAPWVLMVLLVPGSPRVPWLPYCPHCCSPSLRQNLIDTCLLFEGLTWTAFYSKSLCNWLLTLRNYTEQSLRYLVS